jgi:two-component system response regulator (stage 0 sporulation protein F)
MRDSQRPRTPDRTPKPSEVPPNRGRSLRVVFAEDDEAMRQLVTTSLSRKGFNVVECSNGAELAEVIERYIEGRARPSVDVIVSDVQMPGRTGLECLTSIRKFNEKVPFVIITAFGDDRAYEDAFQAGAAAVFNKPFDLEQFVQAICQAVSLDGRKSDDVKLIRGKRL